MVSVRFSNNDSGANSALQRIIADTNTGLALCERGLVPTVTKPQRVVVKDALHAVRECVSDVKNNLPELKKGQGFLEYLESIFDELQILRSLRTCFADADQPSSFVNRLQHSMRSGFAKLAGRAITDYDVFMQNSSLDIAALFKNNSDACKIEQNCFAGSQLNADSDSDLSKGADPSLITKTLGEAKIYEVQELIKEFLLNILYPGFLKIKGRLPEEFKFRFFVHSDSLFNEDIPSIGFSFDSGSLHLSPDEKIKLSEDVIANFEIKFKKVLVESLKPRLIELGLNEKSFPGDLSFNTSIAINPELLKTHQRILLQGDKANPDWN